MNDNYLTQRRINDKAWSLANELTEEERIRLAAALITDTTNTFGVDGLAEEFVDQFTHDHRTLQQSGMSLIIKFIYKYGELDKARYTDGRNQAAHSFAQKFKEWWGGNYGLPTI